MGFLDKLFGVDKDTIAKQEAASDAWDREQEEWDRQHELEMIRVEFDSLEDAGITEVNRTEGNYLVLSQL